MRLSAIIPTWCEARCIGEAVRAAGAVADEVVVSDADSPDGTAEVASEAGARVVRADKGRGLQLDAAAREARGDVLLFLHADARLPPTARAAIAAALAEGDVVGGNFVVRFVPEGGWARFFAWANDVRRRTLRIYYGDSAIFVRRRVYEDLGGFAPVAVMEDYEFVRRLERHGRTAYVRGVEVEVSARRFLGKPMRTLAGWAVVQGLYSLGVPPHRLAALYPDVR